MTFTQSTVSRCNIDDHLFLHHAYFGGHMETLSNLISILLGATPLALALVVSLACICLAAFTVHVVDAAHRKGKSRK